MAALDIELSMDTAKKSTSLLLVSTLLAVITLMSGCGSSGLAGLYPVKGKITQGGKPLDNATISFISQTDGRPATAVSKSDGSYELYTLDSPGAFPGSYSVVVMKMDISPESSNADAGFDASGQDLSMVEAASNAGKQSYKAKQLIPAKYGRPDSTPLKFEVKNTSNVIDLMIES
jgi:hypothetical protein